MANWSWVTYPVTIVPPIREGHDDSDYARQMSGQGNKDFGTGYCCDTFYGMDMFTDDMTCYWCAYGDDWEQEEVSQGLLHPYYIGLRLISDRVGIDFWDIDRNRVDKYVRNESKPRSRFWFGSPCRFMRGIDLMVHVYLPNMLDEKYPELSTYLRTTSPRWGKSWRKW